jgi:hypothetical protein
MTPLTYSDWKAVGWRGALRFLHASFSLACRRAPLGRVLTTFCLHSDAPLSCDCWVRRAHSPAAHSMQAVTVQITRPWACSGLKPIIVGFRICIHVHSLVSACICSIDDVLHAWVNVSFPLVAAEGPQSCGAACGASSRSILSDPPRPFPGFPARCFGI